MGGNGSGNWYRYDARPTVGECLALDVRLWRRKRVLRPGVRFSCRWERDGEQTASVAVRVYDGRVVLSFSYGGKGDVRTDVDQPVMLDWTPCNYGGSRVWFRCPVCKRRCALLYGIEEAFMCRQCGGLTYGSKTQSPLDRQRERAQAIRRQLGGDENIFSGFPPKPPGMSVERYFDLHDEARA